MFRVYEVFWGLASICGFLNTIKLRLCVWFFIFANFCCSDVGIFIIFEEHLDSAIWERLVYLFYYECFGAIFFMLHCKRNG